MTILCRTNICLSNDRFDSTIKRGCSSNAERRHKKKLKMQITCTYTVIDFVLVGKYLYYGFGYLIFNCISLENNCIPKQKRPKNQEIREWRNFFLPWGQKLPLSNIVDIQLLLPKLKKSIVSLFAEIIKVVNMYYNVQMFQRGFEKKPQKFYQVFFVCFCKNMSFVCFFMNVILWCFQGFFNIFFIYRHKLSINRVSTLKCFVFET